MLFFSPNHQNSLPSALADGTKHFNFLALAEIAQQWVWLKPE
jgi:hypothetical protein